MDGPAVVAAPPASQAVAGSQPSPTSKATVAPGQTPTASQIPTPTPSATPTRAAVPPTASPNPIAAATPTPQPGSLGSGSTGSTIPLALGGILVLGLLAGIVTFVLLGRRQTAD